jgi:hypothetical protein
VRRAIILRGRVGRNAEARHRENGIAREAAEARRDDPLTTARRIRRGRAAEGRKMFQVSSFSFHPFLSECVDEMGL